MLALCVTGLAFSVSAAIGFVSLFGVSVMNGILVITYFNELHMQGMGAVRRHAPRRRAADAADADDGAFRLHRPVPAAMSHGIGSQVQRPLATVVVGGMLVGPLMLLMVVPALQLVFLRKSHENGGARPLEPREA